MSFRSLRPYPRFQERCHPFDPSIRGLEDMTNASLQAGPPKSVCMACWRGLTALALVCENGSPPCLKSTLSVRRHLPVPVPLRGSLTATKAHLQTFGDVFQAWMISQIPGGTEGFEQLVCHGKTLRGSAVETEDGRHRYGLRPTA